MGLNINHITTVNPVRIFWRYDGFNPRIITATVLKTRIHWSGLRLIIQPDGLPFTREIHADDVRGYVWEVR